MRLISFKFNGNTYAMYIADYIILYTKKVSYIFDSYYQAIDWIKSGTNGKHY